LARGYGHCFAALQKVICCYANKRIVAGIWYA
jgi:hypothetical protein